jgi:MFS transporter, DHA1 family, inner membrane transport protein
MLPQAREIEMSVIDDADPAAAGNPGRAAPRRRLLSLLALALGTFCIGTTEFASMGMIQLFSRALGVDIPTATHAITAYAVGVVLGAPVLALVAARLNRRTLLLALICLFIVGNVLSAVAGNLDLFIAARFFTGLPQGAYFGAGAVVASHLVGAGHGGRAFAIVMAGLIVATILGSPIATFLGQTLGWRETYLCIAALGGASLLSLWVFVPRTSALDGASVLHELHGLGKPRVWLMMAVAALGISSIFAVYTFIGPFVTDLLLLSPQLIPPALALFGIGMMVGNLYGGRLADRYSYRGIVAGYGVTLVILVVMALFGTSSWVLFAGFFGVGAAMMAAIPTIQVRLVGLAPQSPTLMGAMNLASLNVANALGAWAGGVTIGAGYGLLSPLWAGIVLTGAGLALFVAAMVEPRNPGPR